MDAPLVYAGLVLLLVLGFCLYLARRAVIPECVMPLAKLDEQARNTLLRRKFRLRAAAVALLILAGVSLFYPLPRGVTLLLALGGFYCQYRVFRLRRLYPIGYARRVPQAGDE